MGGPPGATSTSRFRLTVLDLLIGAWVVLWISVAVAVGVQVNNLRDLADTVVVAADSVDSAARALQRTADAIGTTRTGLAQTEEGLKQVQNALDALGSIPLVGGFATGGLADAVTSLQQAADRLRALQGEVVTLATDARVTAASARASGRQAGDSIGTLAILLAIAIAFMPTVPVLAAYLAGRLGWRRPH